MSQAQSKVFDITPRITQRKLRMLAFARMFVECMDSGRAFRDVYRPATRAEPKDKTRGDRLLKIPEVQKLIGEMLKPAMIAMNVDNAFALRRLLETIDSDLTDYVNELPDKDGNIDPRLMSLTEMKEALPLAKRRLVRKYKETFNEFGGIKTREIELEPKQPAMELLAKMRGWVSDGPTIIDGDAMIRLFEAARSAAQDRSADMRSSIANSRTAKQISRPAMVQLTPPISPPPAPVAISPPATFDGATGQKVDAEKPPA